MKYEIIINDNNQEVIKRTDADGKIWWIPAIESNSDYQKYLEDTKDSWTEPVLTK
jgi:hypothetical protein